MECALVLFEWSSETDPKFGVNRKVQYFSLPSIRIRMKTLLHCCLLYLFAVVERSLSVLINGQIREFNSRIFFVS